MPPLAGCEWKVKEGLNLDKHCHGRSAKSRISSLDSECVRIVFFRSADVKAGRREGGAGWREAKLVSKSSA
eukprot:1218094-Rhodomonas_salina.2